MDTKRSVISTLIVPVWVYHKENPNHRLLVYALLDDQSEACFIKESAISELGITGPEVHLRLSTVLGERTITTKRVTGLVVQGVKETKAIQLPPMFGREEIPAKRDQIPDREIIDQYPHLKDVGKILMPVRSEVEVSLLIGANCTQAIRPHEIILGKEEDPYGIRTALGWGVIGITSPDTLDVEDDITVHRIVSELISDKIVKSYIVLRTKVKEIISPSQINSMFEYDFNEKEANIQTLSYEDTKFMKIVKEGIHRIGDDRNYEIPLPFKDLVNLPNNRQMSFRRLMGLKRRLQNNDIYRNDYFKFMNSIIDRGYAERVNSDLSLENEGRMWYLPHHGIYHPNKPDKLRVVFDCSANFKNESLNQHLLQGPILTNALLGVLFRFRQEQIAFACDIEAMFHQVKVNKEHRDYLRFLWWDSNDLEKDPVEYRMTVHLFGATSSPACANYALKTTANQYESEFGKDASDFVRNDFYVDDGLTSVSSVTEAVSLIERSIGLCKRGGFNLNKFISNSDQVLSAIPLEKRSGSMKNLDITKDTLPIERALGVCWCIESDSFQFRIELKDRPLTRRGILSTVSSVFDPIGMVSPVIFVGKGILQELCRIGTDWDSEVPQALRARWEQWRSELHLLEQFSVPRCHKPDDFGEIKSIELHHFSDASQIGYGECSYVRLVNARNEVHCSLVTAKSRVTPLKPITVPRLELTAAVMSARISKVINQELTYHIDENVFWTDSKVVLGYICNESKRFHIFVANRVQQIRDFTAPEQWRYVGTKDNPADYASRGLTAKQIIDNSLWWYGPGFLWKEPLQYEEPIMGSIDISCEDPEVKRVVSLSIHIEERATLLERLRYFSDWYRAKRAVGICLALQQKFKKVFSRHEISKGRILPTTVEHLANGEMEIIKQLQRTAFRMEIDILSLTNDNTVKGRKRVIPKFSPLYRLDPFLDDCGMLRVGGRIKHADIPYTMKHPLILPKNEHVTELIVAYYHQKVQHQGRGMTQNEIRSNGLWIINGSSSVARYISKCVMCKRLRNAPLQQKMADLPEDRLEPAPPFTYCAVDCFGPWYIMDRRKPLKRYGILFTCMASRAIHLEVANTLETDSFINAYRRFVGRRGPVRQLRSDQGTNFVGAKNEMHRAWQQMNKETIRNTLQKDNCDWIDFRMNVPQSSHMGGVWERQIRTIRSILTSLLMQHGTQLDDETLRTFMVEAESIANSRPLTVDTLNDSEGCEPLTPNHLLTMKSKLIMPLPGVFQSADQYSKKRWRRVQFLANEFWNKWKKGYLQSIQSRQKWVEPRRNLQIGDVVIVVEQTLPRNQWKLARVSETFFDKDGFVRKARLAISDASIDNHGKRTRPLTYMERPVQKLILLMSSDEQNGPGFPIEEP